MSLSGVYICVTAELKRTFPSGMFQLPFSLPVDGPPPGDVAQSESSLAYRIGHSRAMLPDSKAKWPTT
jgi:hypothetical protein